MGDYKNQIAKEDFPSQVAEIRSQFDNLPSASKEALEQFDSGIGDRAQTALDHVLVLTATLVPEIVPTDRPGQLTAVLTALEQSISLLTEPANASGYAYQFANALDNLVTNLWTWQGSASGNDWKDSVTGAAATYRRSLGQQLVSLYSELEDLNAHVLASQREVAQLDTVRQDANDRIDSQLDALRERSTERLAALESQIEALQSQVTAAVNRQDQAIQQYQEQFSKAQEKRSQDFTALLQSARTSAEEARLATEGATKVALGDLQNQIDTAKDMVSVFAGAGTANAYGKEAKEQGAAADNWRKTAVVLALVGAIAAAVLVLAFGGAKPSVSEIAGKLGVAVVVAGAAGYAATQSASHRRREVSNRRAELLLVSFEPFVRDLPEEERDKARVALLQTLMSESSASGVDASHDEPVLSASQLNLFRQIFDMMVKR